MKVALSSDHAGFPQLGEIAAYLDSLGHQVSNFGPPKLDPDDDYPDFIFPAAKAVASGECQAGIILGRSGQGEAMAANRIKGVRCAVFYGPAVAHRALDANGKISHDHYEIIRLARAHNHANMLSLAASYVSLSEMKQVINLFLTTPFSEDERHARRVAELDKE